MCHVCLNLPTHICLYQERRRVCSSVPFPGRQSAAVWGSSRSSSHWAAIASCCSSPHPRVCITPQHSKSATQCTEVIHECHVRARGTSASLLSKNRPNIRPEMVWSFFFKATLKQNSDSAPESLTSHLF